MPGAEMCWARQVLFVRKNIAESKCKYAVPENIHAFSPQKGLKFPGGWGGSIRQKSLKKCVN